jgi:hypothetical protein
MESTSFTNWVCGNIFVVSRNVVSSTSLEGPTKSPIIRELKGWPGQNHKLHGSQQTTIKRRRYSNVKPTLSCQETTLQPPAEQKPKSKEKKKKKINTQSY